MNKRAYYGPMPEFYSPDDRVWIGEQMESLPPTLQAAASEKYSAGYQMVLSENDGRINAENLARKRGNTWLRRYISSYANGGLSRAHSLEGVYKAPVRQ